jgi:hypothetical protein
MYINYGDKNFFEHGILVDSEHSDTLIDMLVCEPYPDEENKYMFARIQVDTEAEWLNKDELRRFTGMDLTDPVELAIAAYSYYGPEEFGAMDYGVTYDYRDMDKESIRKELRNYLIAHDKLEL